MTMLEAWFDTHSDTWVAVSGGKDSLVVWHLAQQVKPGVRGVWYDPGVEFSLSCTRRYLDGLAGHFGAPLHKIPTDPPLLDYIAASGQYASFRETVQPMNLGWVAIEEPLSRAVARFGVHNLLGLRTEESDGRRILLRTGKGEVRKHNRRGELLNHALCPVWQWSSADIWAYVAVHRLPVNPVYAHMKRFGVTEEWARTGLLFDSRNVGHVWPMVRAIDPNLARTVEQRLPDMTFYR